MVEVSMIVGALTIMTFFVMIAVMLKGNQAKVYVFDENNNVHLKRGRIKQEGTISFKYNGHSKGGVSIEKNKYKRGKKQILLYREEQGTLIPISDRLITEKKGSLDFSTAQEKRYETEALQNISKKIDNTWAAWVKPLVGTFLIIMGASIVSIVMVQNAMDVEPVPEPQAQMFVNTTHAINDLVESNQAIVESMNEENNPENNQEQSPPR